MAYWRIISRIRSIFAVSSACPGGTGGGGAGAIIDGGGVTCAIVARARLLCSSCAAVSISVEEVAVDGAAAALRFRLVGVVGRAATAARTWFNPLAVSADGQTRALDAGGGGGNNGAA